MMKSRRYAVFFLGVLTFFFTLFIMRPVALFAQEARPQKPNKIEVKDGRVSASVDDEDISAVLKELEKDTRVKITIDKELTGKKVSAFTDNVDIEEAFGYILRDQYYVLTFAHDPADKKKKTLNAIRVQGDVIGSKPVKTRVTTIEIPYGSQRNEVGAAKEIKSGPGSFTVDDTGNIYICDTLNNRIQIFDSYGQYKSTIMLRDGSSADDIVVDRFGQIYVYDGARRKLLQVGIKGDLITSIDADTGRCGGAGKMHIVGNEIFLHVGNAIEYGDCIIGKIVFNGMLVGPSDEEMRRGIESGIREPSGKNYIPGKVTYNKGTMVIEEKDGLTSKQISFASNTIGLQLLGEDDQLNFYLKGSRKTDDKMVVIEVHKFDSNGDYMNSVSLPKAAFYFGSSAKDYAITKDGVIYQFSPAEDKLRINIVYSTGN